MEPSIDEHVEELMTDQLWEATGAALANWLRRKPPTRKPCEIRPGIGLCDDCGKPKWPQRYVGNGCMVCLDCLERFAA